MYKNISYNLYLFFGIILYYTNIWCIFDIYNKLNIIYKIKGKIIHNKPHNIFRYNIRRKFVLNMDQLCQSNMKHIYLII